MKKGSLEELIFMVILLVVVMSTSNLYHNGNDTTSVGRGSNSSRDFQRFCSISSCKSRNCSVAIGGVNETVGENQVSEICEHESNCQRSEVSMMIGDLQKYKCQLEKKFECDSPMCCSAGSQNSERGRSSNPDKPSSSMVKTIQAMAAFIIHALLLVALISTNINVCDKNDLSELAVIRCKKVQHNMHPCIGNLDKDTSHEKTHKLHQIMWHQNSLKSNINAWSWKAWRFMFEFTQKWRVTLTAFPFTLNQLVQEIVQDNREPNQLMRYEWQRYLSFQTFPQESPVMPMRLAQAGFYYTGQGQEVRCFSCDAQNSTWSAEETPLEVHRRISPGCPFIRGESTDNVTIHGQDYYPNIEQ